MLASSKSPTVTLGIIKVAGLVIKLGLITLVKGVWPTERLDKPLAKAWPTGPNLSPINKSTCANSGPSPIRASPILYIGSIKFPPSYNNIYIYIFICKYNYWKLILLEISFGKGNLL